MNEFFQAIIAALARMPIPITNVRYPYPGASYIYIADCYFSADQRTDRCINFERIRLQSPYHRADKIDKAVERIKELLPERMKEQAHSKERKALTEKAREIDKQLTGTPLSVYFIVNGVRKGFTLEFFSPDAGTIAAAADYLQDGGFCSESPPVVSEEEFKQLSSKRKLLIIQELWEHLSPEEISQFWVWLKSGE